MKRIYLDNAAATPVAAEVLAAMRPYFTEVFYNPSALYQGAREAKQALERVRASVASSIGAKPSEIIFTAGGTESANLAIDGVMKAHPGSRAVASAIEHEAVLEPLKSYQHELILVDEHGVVDLEPLKAKLNDDVVLLSVMYVNNEIGTVQPIEAIADIVRQVNRDRKQRRVALPLYFHTDAAQAPLYLDVHVSRLGVDLLTLNGGKMHGPKQSGMLYIKAGTLLQPNIRGGGQEFGYRSGTENVAFAVGFAKALELAAHERRERVEQVRTLRDYMMEALEEQLDAIITGHRKHRIANNVHAAFSGADNERVLFALDELGVEAAAGSACSASKDVSSHVLRALGKNDAYARSSLRFSLGRSTTKADIDYALQKLEAALQA